ncbi:MAG: carboxymuconolactone decarboxylase family protein [Paracoccaceae bacterium]
MTDAYAKMIQQMVESGQEMLRAFNPGLENMQGGLGAGGFDKLFPTMSKDMMEMWFGRTFNREGLDAKTRLFLTLAALTVLGAQAEPQIKMTVRHALEAGATEREIAEVIWQMSMFGGLPAMQKALEIAQAVFAEKKEANP